MTGASVLERAATPVLAAVLSDNSGTDLEDELCHFSPLPRTISPLPESDNDFPVSPSRYPAPPVPAMADPAPATWMSPTPLRVVNTLPMIDAFPTYTLSPAASYYAPATSPVTPAVPVASDYVSPGSPASMDRFLASDSLLLYGPSDLPLLPLLLLPLPVSGVLPLEPAAAHSPVDPLPSRVLDSWTVRRLCRLPSGCSTTPDLP